MHLPLLGGIFDTSSSNIVADHWIDILVGTLITALGYFVDWRFRAIDGRIKALEEENRKSDKEATRIRERLARVETVCKINLRPAEQED